MVTVRRRRRPQTWTSRPTNTIPHLDSLVRQRARKLPCVLLLTEGDGGRGDSEGRYKALRPAGARSGGGVGGPQAHSSSIVCVLLFRYTKMKTATNIYIFNLALADSLFLATLPFQV